MNAFVVLLKKDWRAALNMNRLAREQSRFKLLFMMAFSFGLLAGLLLVFLQGFRFLDAMGGIGLMVIRHLFAIFFFGLGLLLITSNAITSYTTIFRSKEIPFLMLHPISHGNIVVHKLLETTLLSSWPFFFIIVPFVGAYSRHEGLPLFFAVWTFLFSIPFVGLCAILGTTVTLLAVRCLPPLRPSIWAAAAVSIAGWFFFLAPGAGPADGEISFVLSRFVPGLRTASYPLFPSWWVAEGIMASSRGQWVRSSMFMGALVSNVMFAGLVLERIGNAFLQTAWQKTLRSRRPSSGRPSAVFAWADKWLPFAARDVKAIAIKDIRILLRDPVQWTQGMLFFALLGFYFFNLRNLQYHLLAPSWRNLIAFLNIFSLSAVMCSFCSRFVYPQLSLEGQSFWIMGLSPTGMGRVMMIKFAVATAGMLAISVALTNISMLMLNVERGARLSALLIACAMSFALCGLSTGLGAVFLDLEQRNPAAIISGFGGTLNLGLSLLCMFAVILPFGALYHAYHAGHISDGSLQRGLVPAAAWLLAVTGIATALPLVLGRRHIATRDY